MLYILEGVTTDVKEALHFQIPYWRARRGVEHGIGANKEVATNIGATVPRLATVALGPFIQIRQHFRGIHLQ